MTTVEQVLAELDRVHDPEVDEPVTAMGFIREVEVAGDEVVVHMQLPTYFCAPNFTYLMVDDVRRAAERVTGPGRVRVDLAGHFESDRISAAASRGDSFAEAFADQAQEDLEELRDRFLRKTFLIRQEQLCRAAEAAGTRSEDLALVTLGEVAGLGLPEFERYLTPREELGIGCRHTDPFLVAADGRPVGPERLRVHRRSASVMAISFEGNGHLCRALLAERYPHTNLQGEVA